MAYGTYDKHVFDGAVGDASLATALALEAAAAAIFAKTLVEPVTVTRFGFRCTVTFAYDTQTVEGQLSLYKYPAGPGDVANKVLLGTIALVEGYVAGHVYYVNIDNKLGVADLEAGETVAIHVSTAGTGGGGIAGDFQPYFCANPRAEVVGNQGLMHNLTPAVITGNGVNDA